MSATIMLTMMALGLPGGQELTGTVRDDSGRPRPGVAVWVSAGARGDGTVPALVQTETDAQGRFRLAVPSPPSTRSSLEPLSVWAHQSGLVPARRCVAWASAIERDEIELTLVPAEERRILFLDPHGKPAAGARVLPRSFRPSESAEAPTFLGCPDQLSERLTAATDENGEVVLAYLTKDDQVELEVSALGLGSQTFYCMETPAKPISLRAVGGVAGRVVADDPGAVRGVVLAFLTKRDRDREVAYQDCKGRAHVRTDDQGRFAVPALAAGATFVRAEVPTAWPYRVAKVSLGTIEAGRENVVEVVLERAILIKGTVRERGNGRPVAGAWVGIGGMMGEVVSSDAEGCFEGLVLPGRNMAMVIPWGTPRPFFAQSGERPPGVPEDGPIPDFRKFDVAVDAKEFTLPSFELVRGDDLAGSVVDAQGHPVAAARVEGQVVLELEKGKVATTSDALGRFVLRGLDPSRTSLRLEARTPEARTAATVEVAPSAVAPVVLRVGGENLVVPAGRVVDESGRPVAGAEVEVWSKESEYDDPKRVSPRLRTTPDGTYRGDRHLRIDWRYRVRASAVGLTPVQSDWVRFQHGQAQHTGFPDLVLGHPRVIAGRVLDRQGRPVAGALVQSVSDDPARPEVRTDALGQFRLEGCAAGPAFVFAEAPGFRFQGWQNDPASGFVELSLTRPGEPAVRPLATLPGALPEAEETALALAMIEPQIENLRAGKFGSEDRYALELLGRIDPARTLRLLDELKLADGEDREYLKLKAVHRLLRRDADQALVIIEAATDPSLRADGYRRASDVLPASKRAKKEERLTQALVHARGVQDPETRLITLGQIAGRMLAIGATVRATELFHEGLAIARELPTAAMGGYARGAFAEELAELDLPGALALIKDLSEEASFDRHHGNIAHGMASRNPAEAERIWGMLKGGQRAPLRDGIGERVCYRMAPKDPARAHRIALQLTDSHSRAYALGMMADALSANDKDAAAQLLDEALSSLAARAGKEEESYGNAQSAAASMAILLPTAEKIDPGRVSEVLWRALALRGPRCALDHEEIRRLGADAVTAMMVSRYDRALARALLEPILVRLPGLIAGGATYFPETLFAAPVFVDPRRAVAFVGSLPRKTDPEEVDWTRKRLFVAERLAQHGADRWRTAVQDAGFWDVDGYDLGDDD